MILREITAKLSSCKTRTLIAVVVCFLFFPTFIVNAALKFTPSQPPQTNKRIQIVIINSGNQDLPMEREISLGLKKKLKSTLVNADVYQEYLDSARFNEKLQSDIFYDYLKNKYQIKPVDVVISNGIPAANFLSKHPNLFKELKHIFVRSGGVDISHIKNKIYIEASNDYETAVSSLLKLSSPQRIVVLADTRASLARVHLKALKAEFEKIDDKVKVEYITDQPLEIMKQVVAEINYGGVVLMTPIIRRESNDSAIIPYEILSQLESHSSVPIFSFWGSMMGSGTIGGYMLSGKKVGESIAGIIIDLSTNRQIREYNLDFFNEHFYDWRELQKYDLNAKQLFPETKIAFYQPTVFEEYTLELLSTILAFAVLITFSLLLLTSNKKRNVAINALGREQTLLEQRVLERTKALLEQKHKAEEATHAKSDFLANMSHEIRTPINGVMGMLTLLNNTNLDNQQAQYIKFAENSSQSLLTVINDILDFSKIEAGKLDIESIDFNLLKLIEESFTSFAYLASEKHLDLALNTVELSEIWVKGDPNRIKQVFTNLLSNAIKFTELGSVVVRVKTIRKNETVTFIFSVIDSGIGLNANKLSDLFTAFTQADTTTTRKYGGTGLGLSITKQLCLLMGGDISVESIANQGSTFTAQMMLDITKQSKNENHSSQDLSLDLSGKTILLIDHNQKHQEILAEQLNNWGAKTYLVSSKKETLDLIENQQSIYLDLILFDSQVPDLDVVSFSKLVDKKIPTTLLTSIMDFGLNQNYLTNGFIDIIAKPITKTSLIKTLRSAFTSTQPNQESSLLQSTKRCLSQDKDNINPVHQQVNSDKSIRDKTILIVEDNRINQVVALGILKHLNFEAQVANNGQDALIRLEQGEHFDLILMDCQMPIMDGFEATRSIRASKLISNARNLPIIALTANSMKGDREKCIASGMNDFLAKPIIQDDIKQMLNHWLTIE